MGRPCTRHIVRGIQLGIHSIQAELIYIRYPNIQLGMCRHTTIAPMYTIWNVLANIIQPRCYNSTFTTISNSEIKDCVLLKWEMRYRWCSMCCSIRHILFSDAQASSHCADVDLLNVGFVFLCTVALSCRMIPSSVWFCRFPFQPIDGLSCRFSTIFLQFVPSFFHSKVQKYGSNKQAATNRMEWNVLKVYNISSWENRRTTIIREFLDLLEICSGNEKQFAHYNIFTINFIEDSFLHTTNIPNKLILTTNYRDKIHRNCRTKPSAATFSWKSTLLIV